MDRYFQTEGEARRFKAEVDAELEGGGQRTISAALSAYREHLVKKGNKACSIKRTQWSLKKFLDPEDELPLDLIRARSIKRRYDELTSQYAVDSHRNALAEVKTFFKWCKSQGLMSRNPAESIEGIGKRNHGKPQLRASESRVWLGIALDLAQADDKGAIAAIMALLLGLRAQEITLRKVRDIDTYNKPGDTLWIPDSKTRNGRRHLDVPELLRPLLWQQADGRQPDEWLFPGRKRGRPFDRGWPNKQVHRICALSAVPDVCAHSMRGAHATLAMERGATGALVAAQLGHGDDSVTRTSYAKPGAGESANRRKLVGVLDRGKILPRHGGEIGAPKRKKTTE